MSEGKVRLSHGHSIWYRIAGEGDGVPLLLLHGGPGGGHDYLEPFGELSTSRPVVFYDQLGCGRSDIPETDRFYTIEQVCDEIDELRAALALDDVHVLGHSWGGWLLVEWLLRQPKGVKSAVIASSSASVPQFIAEATALVQCLPAEARETLDRLGAEGSFGDPEYKAAYRAFSKRHIFRLDEAPDCLARTGKNLDDNRSYQFMFGPNELVATGNLKQWDRRERLHEIEFPVLITVGEFDEITPACARTLNEGIAGSELVEFAGCAHLPHLEDTQRYLRCLRAFLSRHD